MGAVLGSHDDALLVTDTSDVELNSLRATGTIPGVKVLWVSGRNGPGRAFLRTTGDGRWLEYRAPGSQTFGGRVRIEDDGVYLAEDGEDRTKYIRAEVLVDYLANGRAAAEVILRDEYGNHMGQDDLTAAEAAAGKQTIWQVRLHNVTGVELRQLFLWISVSKGLLELSKNGAVFFMPSSEAAKFGWQRVAAGAYRLLYIRRTISAGTSSAAAALAQLHAAFTTI